MKVNIVIIDQAVVSGSRFLLTLLIAREFGIVEYGKYVVLWSSILLLTSIQTPLIINPMMTIGARTKGVKHDEYFTSILYFQLIFTIISFFILLLIYLISNLFFVANNFSLFLYLSLYGITYNFYEYFRKYLITIYDDKQVLIKDISIYLLIFSGILILMKLSMFSLSSFFLLSFGIYLIFTISIVKYYKIINIDKKTFFQYLNKNKLYSIPMLKLSVMQFFSGHLFIYLSVYLLGSHSSGIIGILRNLFAPLLVLFMMLDNTVPRYATKCYEKGLVELKIYINKLIKNWGIIVLLSITFLTIFSSEIISLFYGIEYSKYATYTLWFSISHLFIYLNRIYSIYIRTTGKTSSFSKQGLYSFLYTIIFTFPLIYAFQLNGAFLVMLTQQIIIFSILLKDSRYYAK